MEARPKLTIVTPSYNRAHTLPRCYASLCAQTCFDFEWLLIDDGSTDDTQRIIEGFRTDRFRLTCVRKENGGKHTALNLSHSFISGDYVLILDSDDYLLPTAVQRVLDGWKRFEGDPDVAVVTFLRGSAPDRPQCRAADEYRPVDIMRYRRICIESSDCCEVIRAEVFRRFPFPVFEGERFLAESALWKRVSFQYKCVYINQVIYICEYLEGGLTSGGRSLHIRNPQGCMYNANLAMARKNYLTARLKNGLLFVCYGFFARLTPRQMAQRCDERLLMWLCFPGGWLLHLYWKRKYA